MSITRAEANANSTTSQNAIMSNADTIFIANVDWQIQQAISQGQFQVTAVSNAFINLMGVYQYYANLGYNVSFPDYANQNGANLPSIIQQPTNYFGYNWTAYWAGLIQLNLVSNPARLTIQWATYSPPTQSPV